VTREGKHDEDRAGIGNPQTVAHSGQIYGDPKRFKNSIGRRFRFYFTGDGARQDEDCYIWVMGRVDD